MRSISENERGQDKQQLYNNNESSCRKLFKAKKQTNVVMNKQVFSHTWEFSFRFYHKLTFSSLVMKFSQTLIEQ